MRVVDRNGPPRAQSPVVVEEGEECMYEGGPSASGMAVTVREREGPGAVRGRPGRPARPRRRPLVVFRQGEIEALKLSLGRTFVRLFCILKNEIVE